MRGLWRTPRLTVPFVSWNKMSSGDPGSLSNQKELPPDKASQGLPNTAMDRLASIRGIAETISISRQHGSVNDMEKQEHKKLDK